MTSNNKNTVSYLPMEKRHHIAYADSENHRPSFSLCCQEKTPPYHNKLADQWEQHQAMQDFYHTALLALSTSDEYQEYEDWHYGAFLLSKHLAKQGEELIETIEKLT
ncbi:hypothetical protein AB835_11350 [Candidatus Endobugula sertula]|uniref:Uncharacterized protein n=1 Tax=Candidatus Endobugula sertula TaxID=62101 RepID=A0A1D2QMZ7_9GAMM|nr:hypothetical protein AB835_11350 [Candidatus Endobugula sertula]